MAPVGGCRGADHVLIHAAFAGTDAMLAPTSGGHVPVGLDNTEDPSMNSVWTHPGLAVATVAGLAGPSERAKALCVGVPRCMDCRAIRIAPPAGAPVRDGAAD
ncbi:MAG: hypothetical protein CML66_17225 [Rhodobacteraceae bacterium]|nr:hypothetical protein [Paracoccaceae bacterium]MAY44054.1 hypothetical protein [Paracoccaceae bacterium]QEW18681.1 hypothetical protein LA6_000850 [Marinibacterium anthonyi]